MVNNHFLTIGRGVCEILSKFTHYTNHVFVQNCWWKFSDYLDRIIREIQQKPSGQKVLLLLR